MQLRAGWKLCQLEPHPATHGQCHDTFASLSKRSLTELFCLPVRMDGGRERADGSTARKYIKPVWKRTRRVMKGDCYKVRATA